MRTVILNCVSLIQATFFVFSNRFFKFFFRKKKDFMLCVRRKVNNPRWRINAKFEKWLLSTRKLGVWSGSLIRNRSSNFDGKTSSNTIYHYPPTILFGEAIKKLSKKDLSWTKIALADPRHAMQRLIASETSVRSVARYLETPRTTTHKLLHSTLSFRPYINQVLHKIEENDWPKGKKFLCP